MRFPQTETPNSVPVCPRGHYNQGSGGGCRLSTDVNGNNVTTAETAYGAWFDTGASEALLVPVTKAATGLKPLAASDFDPDGGNISAVYRWIDQTETAGAVTTITDPELRSPPNNSTPLGRSLYYARLYFNNYVKAKDTMGNPIDPKSACRANLVIIVTDGAEMCDANKGSALNLTTCAQTGYATYNPEVQACNLNIGSKVPTYLLTDAGLTAAEKTAANAIAAAGGTSQAIFVTLTDTAAVKQALI